MKEDFINISSGVHTKKYARYGDEKHRKKSKKSKLFKSKSARYLNNLAREQLKYQTERGESHNYETNIGILESQTGDSFISSSNFKKHIHFETPARLKNFDYQIVYFDLKTNRFSGDADIY